LEHQNPLVLAGGGDDVPVDALGLLGKPLDIVGAVGDFPRRFAEGLALLGGEDGRQVVLVGHQQVEPGAQNVCPLLGGLVAPGGECGLGGGDGAPGLGGTHVGHPGENFAGGGVAHLKGVAAVGIHPAAVDIGPGLQQLGIFQGQAHGLAPMIILASWPRMGSWMATGRSFARLTKTWVKVPWAQAVLSPVRKMPIPYSTELLPSLLTRKPPSMASGKEMPLL